jgi:hypothetical protein
LAVALLAIALAMAPWQPPQLEPPLVGSPPPSTAPFTCSEALTLLAV